MERRVRGLRQFLKGVSILLVVLSVSACAENRLPPVDPQVVEVRDVAGLAKRYANHAEADHNQISLAAEEIRIIRLRAEEEAMAAEELSAKSSAQARKLGFGGQSGKAKAKVR